MESNEELLSPPGGGGQPKAKKRAQVLAAAMAWTAPLSMGFGIGYSSPAIPQLEKSRMEGGLDMTVDQTSWFASLLAVGALFGGPFAGLVTDKLGRKFGIMLSGLPFVIGWLLITWASDVYVLYAGRFLTGFGCGMASLSAPTYIAEVTDKHLRGLLGGGFQLAVVTGVLAAFCLGIPLTYQWLAVGASLVATCMVVFMLIVPETPRWYFAQAMRAHALRSLKWLRGGEGGAGMEAECAEIEQSLAAQGESIRVKDMFIYPNLYKPFLISLALMFFQQFSGINAVIFFSDSIFSNAGFASDTEQQIASVILAAVQVVFTFVGCLLMDTAGRRVLLVISGSVMAASCVTFALYYILTLKHVVASHVWYMQATSIGSLAIYISGFSIGWGPIPWLIMSEIFPAKARGLSSGVATATNWTCAFLVTRFFRPLQQAITPYGTFIAFAVINVLGVIFVVVFLPETKGKSLEDIERHFNRHLQYDPIENENDDANADTD